MEAGARDDEPTAEAACGRQTESKPEPDPNIRLNRGVIMKREYARASNDAAGKGRSGPLNLAGRMPGYVWVSEDGAYYRQT